MAAKNTGIPYERVVQSIFQAIHDQERAQTIDVKHNVKLVGNSGAEHQIDVYWEFKLGGLIYRTLVSAKDWAGNIKKEQVLSFKSILDDIPGQPRGVIVARKGYQSGAETFAKHLGIVLYVIRRPDDEFWNGRARKLVLETQFFEPSYTRLGFDVDQAWLARVQAERGQQNFKVSFHGESNRLFLSDEADTSVESLYEAFSRLFPTPAFAVLAKQRMTHQFTDATYLGPDGSPHAARVAA